MKVEAIVQQYVANMKKHRAAHCTGLERNGIKMARGSYEHETIRHLQRIEQRYAMELTKRAGGDRHQLREYIEQTGL